MNSISELERRIEALIHFIDRRIYRHKNFGGNSASDFYEDMSYIIRDLSEIKEYVGRINQEEEDGGFLDNDRIYKTLNRKQKFIFLLRQKYEVFGVLAMFFPTIVGLFILLNLFLLRDEKFRKAAIKTDSVSTSFKDSTSVNRLMDRRIP